MSSFPETSTLLALSEICATLLGFVGVVLVLGRRSAGEWKPMERARFVTLLTGSIGALTLALAPLVLSADGAFHFAGLVCAVSLYLIARAGLNAIRHPEGSTLLAVLVIVGSIVLLLLLIATDLDLLTFSHGTLYLAAILWHISVACTFFVRLISLTR